jgi:hypothetical protein
MTMSAAREAMWPALRYAEWADTCATLHRWTQVVGKIRLALAPPINHFWHSTLYIAPRGLTTSAIPYGDGLFEIGLDLVDHVLTIDSSWAPRRAFSLEGKSVADFYRALFDELHAVDIDVRIWTKPVEVPERTAFDQDTQHAGYAPEAAEGLLHVLAQVDRVFSQFRGEFLGKCSPVHFFWGAFDLAVTRFSGRRSPSSYQGAAPFVHPHVMHESYSHEVSSAGFWPGDDSSPPVFYSYAAPEPDGFRSTPITPAGASYFEALGEFVLPYAAVRSAADPDATLLAFLRSTYAAAADRGGWDRELLEQRPACTCTPAEIAALQHGVAHVH